MDSANYCFEKLVWMSKKKGAIIHCDKYTPFSRFVTKDKPNHKEIRVVYLKTIEED